MGECFECGGVAEHDHHVVPRSRGGTKTVPLCTKCHARAHGLHDEWATDHKKLVSDGQRRARSARKGVVARVLEAARHKQSIEVLAEIVRTSSIRLAHGEAPEDFVLRHLTADLRAHLHRKKPSLMLRIKRLEDAARRRAA